LETGLKLGSADLASSRSLLGTNQSGMREHNERLVLSLVREHGSLAKSDIARATKLSAQTVSVIMRELEAEGLLLREEPVRGRIGQPSIPMSLNPEGAFFIGLKIGRRSSELVLIDFAGTVRSMVHRSYPYPAAHETIDFVMEGIATMRAGLTPEQDARIAGMGIAMPFQLWNWAQAVGAPSAVMDQWRDLDIRAEVQTALPFPVYLQNDATSACGAELVFGRSVGLRDFVYFYIGAFAGGGIVLDGKLYSGPTGNAGALASRHSSSMSRRSPRWKRRSRRAAQNPPICGPRRTTGAMSGRTWTHGSPRPPKRWPMPSLPPARSSTSVPP
jgi:hypothetical protein